VNGLQAAISGPRGIRFNEITTSYLVLRNASQNTLRLTLPLFPGVTHIRPEGSTLSYGLNKPAEYVDRVKRWEINPGHQIVMPLPPIQVLVSGDFGLNRALTSLQPGPHTLYARTGSAGEFWATDNDGKRRKITVPKGERKGWLSPPRFGFEMLKDKAPFSVSPLPVSPLNDLPAGHGIKHVVATPPTLNSSATEWIRLRYGLKFALDSSKDEHWLRDFGTYNRVVYWGRQTAGIEAARKAEKHQ
jgi:hypothetical protein